MSEPTISAPAVSVSSASSLRCSSAMRRAPKPFRGAPTSTARSTGGATAIIDLLMRYLLATERAESAGLRERNGEVAHHRSHRHVAGHAIVDRAGVEERASGGAKSRIGERHRNPD